MMPPPSAGSIASRSRPSNIKVPLARSRIAGSAPRRRTAPGVVLPRRIHHLQPMISPCASDRFVRIQHARGAALGVERHRQVAHRQQLSHRHCCGQWRRGSSTPRSLVAQQVEAHHHQQDRDARCCCIPPGLRQEAAAFGDHPAPFRRRRRRTQADSSSAAATRMRRPCRSVRTITDDAIDVQQARTITQAMRRERAGPHENPARAAGFRIDQPRPERPVGDRQRARRRCGSPVPGSAQWRSPAPPAAPRGRRRDMHQQVADAVVVVVAGDQPIGTPISIPGAMSPPRRSSPGW